MFGCFDAPESPTNQVVHCVWEDEKSTTQRGGFHADTLQICNLDDDVPYAMVIG